MGSPILTLATPVLCPHGGLVSFVPTTARLLAAGAPVLTVHDAAIVAGCPDTGDGGPCVRVEWYPTGSTLTVDGKEVLTMTTPGAAMTAQGAPTGAPTIAGGDPRVVA